MSYHRTISSINTETSRLYKFGRFSISMLTANYSFLGFMITGKVQRTIDLAALNKTESNIWKRLTIIETEAWFNTVAAIASGASSQSQA